MPKTLRKVASSIFAPAKTEPIWTLEAGFQKPRTGDKDVCKLGGGAAPPPPQPPPPLFFSPCKKIAPSTHQTRSCYGFFSHRTGCLFANEGLRSRQHPRVIFKLCKIAAAIILATKTKPLWTPSEPVKKVFANGGGCAPPQPPAG